MTMERDPSLILVWLMFLQFRCCFSSFPNFEKGDSIMSDTNLEEYREDAEFWTIDKNYREELNRSIKEVVKSHNASIFSLSNNKTLDYKKRRLPTPVDVETAIREVSLTDASTFTPMLTTIPNNYICWKFASLPGNDLLIAQRSSSLDFWLIQSAERYAKLENATIEIKGTILDYGHFYWSCNGSNELNIVILWKGGENSFNIDVYQIKNDFGKEKILSLDLPKRISSTPHLRILEIKENPVILVLESSPFQAFSYIIKEKCGASLIKFQHWTVPGEMVDFECFTYKDAIICGVSTFSAFLVYELNTYKGPTQDDVLSVQLKQSHGDFSNVVDVEHFMLGGIHFIAIIDSTEQHFLQWNGNSFQLVSSFKFPQVVRAFAVPLLNCVQDAIILLFRDEKKRFIVTPISGRVIITEYGSLVMEFYQSTLGEAKPMKFNSPPHCLLTFRVQRKTVLLVTEVSKINSVFIVKTRSQQIGNPVEQLIANVTKWIKNMDNLLRVQNKTLQELREVLEYSVPKTGGLNFHKKIQLGAINMNVADTLILPRNTSVVGIVTALRGASKDTKTKMNTLLCQMDKLKNTLDALKRQFQSAVFIDKPAVIKGQKLFHGTITVPNIVADDSEIGGIDGNDVSQTINTRRFKVPPTKSEGYFIPGQARFENTIQVDVLILRERLNGLRNNAFAVTDKEQIITSPVLFEDKVEMVNPRVDIINGISMKKIVTLKENVIVSTRKNFSTVKVRGSANVKGLVDFVNISYVGQNRMRKNRYQFIDEVRITSDVKVNGHVDVDYVNGYDLSTELASIVRVDRPYQLNGTKIFDGPLNVKNDVTVDGLIDGVNLPHDLLVIQSPNQIIPGQKNFTRLIVGNVTVQSKIDDLQVPKDIITLTGNETITNATFLSMLIASSIESGGAIGNFKAKELARNISTIPPRVEIVGTLINIANNLNVTGTINDIKLANFAKDIVLKNDNRSNVIASKKTFNIISINRNLTVNKLNNLCPTDFLTTNASTQNVSEDITFEAPVIFNNINVTFIDSVYMSREDDDNETGVIFDNLRVTKIDGIRPEDIVTKSGPVFQIVANKTFLAGLTATNVVVTGNISADIIASVNLKDFKDSVVNLLEDQLMENIILGEGNSAAFVNAWGQVNGFNFTTFINNIMSTTKPQIILGIKTFSGTSASHAFGDIKTYFGVNGYDLQEINRKAMKINETNCISQTMNFRNNLVVNKIVVLGLVNGQQLDCLSSEVILKNSAQEVVVLSHVDFLDTVHINGDIQVGKIVYNTRSFGKRLVYTHKVIGNAGWNILLKTKDQIINGSLEILNNIKVRGNISGAVKIGNSRLQIRKLLQIEGKNPVINGNLVFRNPVSIGCLDQVSTEQSDTNQILLMSKEFPIDFGIKGPIKIGKGLEVEKINGQNWKDFLNDVVFIASVTDKQEIDTDKTFENIVVTGPLKVFGKLEVLSGNVNNVDLLKLEREAAYKNRNTKIHGIKRFKEISKIMGDITINGKINGLNLHSEVATRNTAQTFIGMQTFRSVLAKQSIQIAGSVNGHKSLKQLERETFLVKGNQNIHSLNIQGSATFVKDVKVNFLNEHRPSTDYVFLDSSEIAQVIKGKLVLKDTTVERGFKVDGLLNEVNVSVLFKSSVVNFNDVIDFPINFEEAVFKRGFNISLDSDTLRRETSNQPELTALLNKNSNRMVRINDTLNGKKCAIHYFVLYRQVQVYAHRIKSFETSDGTILIFLGGTMQSSTIDVLFYHFTSDRLIAKFSEQSPSWSANKDEGTVYLIKSDIYNDVCTETEQISNSGQILQDEIDLNLNEAETIILITITESCIIDSVVIQEGRIRFVVAITGRNEIVLYRMHLDSETYEVTQVLQSKDPKKIFVRLVDEERLIIVKERDEVKIFVLIQEKLYRHSTIIASIGEYFDIFQRGSTKFYVTDRRDAAQKQYVQVYASRSLEEKYRLHQEHAVSSLRALEVFEWKGFAYMVTLQKLSLEECSEDMLVVYSLRSGSIFKEIQVFPVSSKSSQIHIFQNEDDLFIALLEVEDDDSCVKIYKAILKGSTSIELASYNSLP